MEYRKRIYNLLLNEQPVILELLEIMGVNNPEEKIKNILDEQLFELVEDKNTPISLSEYLNNDKITCITKLSRKNWKRLLNCDCRILEKIEEWKNYDLEININSFLHTDTCLRTPEEKGYKHFFYDERSKMYISFNLEIKRNLSKCEISKYGTCATGLCISFDLPLNMWITVYRSDIQREKYFSKKNKCKCKYCN